MLDKINWGWRITIVYLGFVVFMLMLVFKTQQQDIELVTTDYYAKELKYQEQLDKINRANQLPTPLSWKVESSGITLQFPPDIQSTALKAKVLFYCPSDSKKDVTVECTIDESGKCLIPSDKLQQGVYQMQVDWSAGSTAYYSEGTINVH